MGAFGIIEIVILTTFGALSLGQRIINDRFASILGNEQPNCKYDNAANKANCSKIHISSVS